MRQKANTNAQSTEDIVKGIRRATRKRYSAEEKIRIVLDGLRGEHTTISALSAFGGVRWADDYPFDAHIHEPIGRVMYTAGGGGGAGSDGRPPVTTLQITHIGGPFRGC